MQRELEMQQQRLDNVEDIYKRCLPVCRNLELMYTYVEFVRRKTQGQPDHHQRVCDAFELALEKMGLGYDMRSGPLWRRYLDHVRQMETPSMAGLCCFFLLLSRLSPAPCCVTPARVRVPLVCVFFCAQRKAPRRSSSASCSCVPFASLTSTWRSSGGFFVLILRFLEAFGGSLWAS